VNPPAITAAPPPPTAHKMLRTPRSPSSLFDRYSLPRGKASSSRTQRGVISSNVSSICACKSGARLLAPSSYTAVKINTSLFYQKYNSKPLFLYVIILRPDICKISLLFCCFSNSFFFPTVFDPLYAFQVQKLQHLLIASSKGDPL